MTLSLPSVEGANVRCGAVCAATVAGAVGPNATDAPSPKSTTTLVKVRIRSSPRQRVEHRELASETLLPLRLEQPERAAQQHAGVRALQRRRPGAEHHAIVDPPEIGRQRAGVAAGEVFDQRRRYGDWRAAARGAAAL